MLKILKQIIIYLTLNTIISVHGQWGEWAAWTTCDNKPCRAGKQSRERQCDSPAPGFKGDPCDGEATETQWCNTDPCEGIKRIHIYYYFLSQVTAILVRKYNVFTIHYMFHLTDRFNQH